MSLRNIAGDMLANAIRADNAGKAAPPVRVLGRGLRLQCWIERADVVLVASRAKVLPSDVELDKLRAAFGIPADVAAVVEPDRFSLVVRWPLGAGGLEQTPPQLLAPVPRSRVVCLDVVGESRPSSAPAGPPSMPPPDWDRDPWWYATAWRVFRLLRAGDPRGSAALPLLDLAPLGWWDLMLAEYESIRGGLVGPYQSAIEAAAPGPIGADSRALIRAFYGWVILCRPAPAAADDGGGSASSKQRGA